MTGSELQQKFYDKPETCGHCQYSFQWPYGYGPNCNHPQMNTEFKPVNLHEESPTWCPV